jgi:hypothetical protein
MKFLPKTIVSLAFILLFFGFTTPQETFNEKVVRTLKKLTQDFPQEKVFLHLDKSYYLSGETIFFKAYLTAGSFNQLSPLSKTLYVELINDKNEKIEKRIIQIKEGVGSGDIAIFSEVPSGNYLLRAYSNWMRNFGQEFFFQRELKIWNIDTQPEQTANQVRKAIDLQFFPEGGHWISGIKSNLAFKAIGSDGLGKRVTGKILSSNGEIVADFQDSHLGMGVVSFAPVKGATYYAEIAEEPGIKYAMPEVANSGFGLVVTNKPEQTDVVVKIQTNSQPLQPEPMALVVHARGELTFFAKITLSNVVFFAKIPKAKLVSGLSHISLFNSEGKIISDRLSFLDKGERLQIKVSGLKDSYKPREKVEFDLETLNGDSPVSAALSLSAVNENESLADKHDATISNYLNLTSDLKGNIESPGYYFDDTKVDRLAKLDLLLLTQGWTRFSWEKLLNDQWPSITHFIEQGVNIKGELTDELTKAPIDGGKVTFFSASNLTDIVVTPTGKNGKFVFDGLIFYDSSKVVLQGENKKGKKFVKFKLDSIFPAQPVKYSFTPFDGTLTEFEKSIIKKGEERRKIDNTYSAGDKAILLESVEVKEKKIDPLQESRVYKGASKTILAEKVPGSAYLNHPLELVRGASGVQLRPDPPGYSVTIRGAGSISAGISPLILLDNVPTPVSTLNTIPVSSIASVDIFTGAQATVFGSQGGNGVIAFFTRKGANLAAETKGVYSFDLKGYNTSAEFYSPKYDVNKPEHAKPDRRVTIQWLPNIVSDENGKVHVSFFNPDPECGVRIDIQGMNKSGLVGNRLLNYQIKN